MRMLKHSLVESDRHAFARGFRAGLSVSPHPLSEIVVLRELKRAWEDEMAFQEHMKRRKMEEEE